MGERVINFYQKIINQEKGTVLFVTHGGPIIHMMRKLFNQPDFIPKNTSVTEIEIKDGKAELVRMDDTKHLDSF